MDINTIIILITAVACALGIYIACKNILKKSLPREVEECEKLKEKYKRLLASKPKPRTIDSPVKIIKSVKQEYNGGDCCEATYSYDVKVFFYDWKIDGMWHGTTVTGRKDKCISLKSLKDNMHLIPDDQHIKDIVDRIIYCHEYRRNVDWDMYGDSLLTANALQENLDKVLKVLDGTEGGCNWAKNIIDNAIELELKKEYYTKLEEWESQSKSVSGEYEEYIG